MTGPIRPEEFEDPEIPEIVYRVVNNLIYRKWDGYEATFSGHDVWKLLEGHKIPFNRRGHLVDRDIVRVYREAGWVVECHNPQGAAKGFLHFSKRRLT